MGLTEFPAELNEHYERLEDREGFFTRYKRKDRNILEVCRTIAGIEGDGLVSFWDSEGINQGRAIKAFREIGCGELADFLEKSKWVKKIIKRGVTEPDGQYKFTLQEEAEFDAIEDAVFDRLQEAADLAQAYLKEVA